MVGRDVVLKDDAEKMIIAELIKCYRCRFQVCAHTALQLCLRLQCMYKVLACSILDCMLCMTYAAPAWGVL